NEIDKIKTADHLVVWPATRKIGRPVNPVIERAGEMEVRRDQSLDCRTILGNVGFVSRARDCDDVLCAGSFFFCHRLKTQCYFAFASGSMIPKSRPDPPRKRANRPSGLPS